MNQPAPSLQSQFWSVARAAHLLDACDETIVREIKRGRLGAHRVGREYRIKPEDLVKYLERSYCATQDLPFTGAGVGTRMNPGDLELLWQRLAALVRAEMAGQVKGGEERAA